MDTLVFILTFSLGVLSGCLFVSLTKRQLIKSYRLEITNLRNQLLRKKR